MRDGPVATSYVYMFKSWVSKLFDSQAILDSKI